ncbi:hypothetical protein FRC09_019869 [Ceratobasidium sp. 395]|nr:hypothetical protein FRC09_019869 [Ceratobasidium sp. 395]
MKSKFASTGHHGQQIVDIYSRDGTELPSNDHFHAFFAKFGSILQLHRHRSSSSKITHVYIAFKTEAAIRDLQEHLNSPKEASYWKKSCTITIGLAACPAELVKRIEEEYSKSSYGITTSTSESNKQISEAKGVPIHIGISRHSGAESSRQEVGKRRGDEPARSERPDQNKKRRFTNEAATTSQFVPLQQAKSTQQHTWSQSLEAHSNEAHATQGLVGELPARARSPRVSALDLAQRAAELASSKPKRARRVEDDDIQIKLERLRAERDEAILQRDAAIKSNQHLERELQQLKQLFSEKEAKTEKVLRLVTASLQSLQESS